MPQPVRPALADPAPATPADFMGDAEMMLTGEPIHNPPSYSQVMTEDIRAQLFPVSHVGGTFLGGSNVGDLSNTSPAPYMPETAVAAMCSLTCAELAELCDETDGCRGTGQGILLQQVTGDPLSYPCSCCSSSRFLPLPPARRARAPACALRRPCSYVALSTASLWTFPAAVLTSCQSQNQRVRVVNLLRPPLLRCGGCVIRS